VEWTESQYSQQTAMRLARSGAWIRIVTAEDACEVCKAMARRAYRPSDVPRLPIAGCENGSCRCRFEAVDPQTELSVPKLVDLGIHELKIGREKQAGETLRRAVTLDEEYERGWLWLSAVVDDDEKMAYLEKVLSINPANVHARVGLEALRQRREATAPTPEPALEPEDAASAPEPTLEPEDAAPGPKPALEPEVAAPTLEPTLGPEDTAPAPEPTLEPEDAASAPEPTLEPEVTAPAPAATTMPDQPEPTDRAGPISEDMLATIHALRDGRQVIVEHWIEFMGLADQVDAQVLQVQAEAFVERLQDANAQTLGLLSDEDVPPESRVEELYLQWQESEEMGEALAQVIEEHRAADQDAPNWQPMRNVLSRLGREMIAHRAQLRDQIAAAGGATPE
jgi:hypothetical protein